MLNKNKTDYAEIEMHNNSFMAIQGDSIFRSSILSIFTHETKKQEIHLYKLENEYYKNISSMLLGKTDYKNFIKSIEELSNKSPDINELLKELYAELDLSENAEAIYDYYDQTLSLIRVIYFIEYFCGWKNRSYFVDKQEKSVGVIIFGKGTLKIKFKKGNIAEFNHARKTDYGGILSSEGKMRITKYFENSFYIKHILDFII